MDTNINYRITSDTHFNHLKEMIEYCNRPANYEQKIIKWLLQIPKKDILIHLWDICIREDIKIHKEYIQKIQCKKILVKGNHDRKSNNWYLNNWWDFVCNSFILWYEWKNILFQHQPDILRTDYQVHWHYHNSNHRWNFTNDKCFLYAQELFNYQPILLRNLLEWWKKKSN